jgi:aspartate/methionine/tyrosine aminotransferase
MFEPAFDIYHAQADMAGAHARTVPLTTFTNPQTGKLEWRFDPDQLRKAFTSKTRIFLLNTPHNPTGKVFTRAELELIVEILRDFPDVVVVADEVYEHIVYDGFQHIPIASLPGMWDRTLTCSSAGKMFSVTGWKIGWAVGPAYLIRPPAIAHQWTVFSVNTPAQAVARALVGAEKPYRGHRNYYSWLAADYTRKRQMLADGLAAAGLTPIIPEGSFFIVADTRKIKVPAKWLEDKSEPYDWRVCRFLTVDIGVAAIPPSSFYCDANKDMAKYFARFAFCKPDEVIQEACRRLAKLKEHVGEEERPLAPTS